MALVQIHLGSALGLANRSKIAQEVTDIICKYSDCPKESIEITVWQNSPDKPESDCVFMVKGGKEKQYPNSVCIY
ncbi:MAG: hypothetical protein H6Q75_1159 [Firmicutes bacterium]|nr:hypothetical protein [Bacillota bacterium]